jgi:hypothetical protein
VKRHSPRVELQCLRVELQCLRVKRQCLRVKRQCLRVELQCLRVKRQCLRVELQCLRVKLQCLRVERHSPSLERQALSPGAAGVTRRIGAATMQGFVPPHRKCRGGSAGAPPLTLPGRAVAERPFGPVSGKTHVRPPRKGCVMLYGAQYIKKPEKCATRRSFASGKRFLSARYEEFIAHRYLKWSRWRLSSLRPCGDFVSEIPARPPRMRGAGKKPQAVAAPATSL